MISLYVSKCMYIYFYNFYLPPNPWLKLIQPDFYMYMYKFPFFPGEYTRQTSLSLTHHNSVTLSVSIYTMSGPKRKADDTSLLPALGEPAKKKRRRVVFQDVTVYYFNRRQGFVCVPSQV